MSERKIDSKKRKIGIIFINWLDSMFTKVLRLPKNKTETNSSISTNNLEYVNFFKGKNLYLKALAHLNLKN